MIIKPQLPGGFVIFCDDIREEVSGKTTLVGTYGTEMTVWSDPPGFLPQFCAVIAFRQSPDNLPQNITLKIVRIGAESETLWEGGAELPAADPDMFPPSFGDKDTTKFVEVRAVQRFFGLRIPEDSDLSVRAIVGDDEIRLGSLRIRFCKPD